MKRFTGIFLLLSFGFYGNIFAGEIADCKKSNYVPNQTLGLEKILELGLCRNPITAAAYYSAEAARANKNASYSGYMPEISVSGDYGLGRNEFHPDNGIDTTSYSTTGAATLTANYLLFDFGKRESEVSQMTYIWRAVDFDRNKTVQNYVYDLISAYYNVLMMSSNENVAKKLLDVASESLDMSETKFKAGVVAKIDVLQAKTTYSSRELDYQKAIANTKNAEGQLLYLLDYSQGQKITLKNDIDLNDIINEKQSVNDLIKNAMRNRPDLQSAAATKEAQKANWDSTARTRLPSISAYGSYGWNDISRGSNPGDGNSGAVGLRASMPLFSGLSLMYNQRSAKESYLASEEQYKQTENQVALDVWTAYQNYQTAIEAITTTKTLLKSATESERASREMYKVGRVTMLDWLTTQSDFANAEYQSVYAKYDYFIKKAALALAIGDLTKK